VLLQMSDPPVAVDACGDQKLLVSGKIRLPACWFATFPFPRGTGVYEVVTSADELFRREDSLFDE
jgi:hypothetical protein